MAQRTGTLGLLIVAAIMFVVSGCGGGSATQTTGKSRPSPSRTSTASSRSPKKSTVASAGGANAAPRTKAVGRSGEKKKKTHHPPIVIPKGEPEPAQTPEQKEEATVADMLVSSAAVDGAGALSRTYTCDGKGISLPIEWQDVPANAQEIAIFVMNLVPVEGKLFFDWAVAGIEPKVGSLQPGQIPAGAVVGRNSEGKVGYSLCPNGQTGETYVIAIYAMTKAAHPKQGFEPMRLREEAKESSKTAGLLSMSYGG